MTFPPADLIEAHAAGELDQAATVALVQHLVDSGLAWKHTRFRSLAVDLIAQGLVTRPETRRTPA